MGEVCESGFRSYGKPNMSYIVLKSHIPCMIRVLGIRNDINKNLFQHFENANPRE